MSEPSDLQPLDPPAEQGHDALLDEILGGLLHDAPISTVSGTVVSLTPDAAVVSLFAPPGSSQVREGILPITEWYANTPLPKPGTVLFLARLDDAARPTLSAVHADLVTALLEVAVPEIRHGDVRIMAVARNAGSRSKVAVAATREGIDPVALCVGRSANRIKYVTSLLDGTERVDLVSWHPDKTTFVANALAPAGIESVVLRDGVAVATAPAHQMAAAVGAKGQNSALAARLVGTRISVISAENVAAENPAASVADHAAD